WVEPHSPYPGLVSCHSTSLTLSDLSESPGCAAMRTLCGPAFGPRFPSPTNGLRSAALVLVPGTVEAYHRATCYTRAPLDRQGQTRIPQEAAGPRSPIRTGYLLRDRQTY